MSNEEKLEQLKQWLTDNGHIYEENHQSNSCGIIIPIRVKKTRIAVRIGDDAEFYDKVRKIYAPFFIRDTDSAEFVIEKMTNCIQMVRERMAHFKALRIKRAEEKERQQRQAEEKAKRQAAKEKANRPKRKRIMRFEKV